MAQAELPEMISEEDIVAKITAYLENDRGNSPILTFLAHNRDTRYWTVLRSVFTNDVAFYKTVDKLIVDTQILENDTNYRSFMNDVWENYVKPNENKNVGVKGHLILSMMRRYSKNFIDSFVGMVVGVTVGSYIVNEYEWMASTPMAMGSIIGAVSFGVTSAMAPSTKISDWCTKQIFILFNGAALENAYKFLRLEYGASNDEINSSFVQLALEYHPYQVNRRSQEQGIEQQEQSNENWQNLANSMNNIKLSKGEF